ncbi:hypothetical protein P7K49_002162 [Saguinus oedipus]|uniref:Uncharacterized protein n=1 Tax=Saguinus oedipus TaxID=9490 RepID=A0ABQ9WGL9_SAGOE|nr:hypothetical protein P7K49_002162 [Saguinus oedipus]
MGSGHGPGSARRERGALGASPAGLLGRPAPARPCGLWTPRLPRSLVPARRPWEGARERARGLRVGPTRPALSAVLKRGPAWGGRGGGGGSAKRAGSVRTLRRLKQLQKFERDQRLLPLPPPPLPDSEAKGAPLAPERAPAFA